MAKKLKAAGVGRPPPPARMQTDTKRQGQLYDTARASLRQHDTFIVEGYVGVVDGRPVFETVSDSKGNDAERFDVYADRDEALLRWAWVRKVYVVVEGEDLPQPKDRGEL